jgi:excisionase family DNA binding protein
MELKLDLDHQVIAQAIASEVKTILKEVNQSRLLTVEELADYLQVPKGWIYDRTRIAEDDGGIPRVKVGKYVRFNLQDVLNWLKENESTKTD